MDVQEIKGMGGQLSTMISNTPGSTTYFMSML